MKLAELTRRYLIALPYKLFDLDFRIRQEEAQKILDGRLQNLDEDELIKCVYILSIVLQKETIAIKPSWNIFEKKLGVSKIKIQSLQQIELLTLMQIITDTLYNREEENYRNWLNNNIKQNDD